MRLFVGIWPPAPWIEALAGAQETLREATPRGQLRLTHLGQLHVTLRFLGDVDDARVESLLAALRDAVQPAPCFRLGLGEIGAFPSLQRARVSWVGLSGELTAVHALQAAAARAVDDFAAQPEDRAFHPHVTIGRVRQGAGPLRLVETTGGFRVRQAGDWRVDSVRLVRSELRPEGSCYTTVAEIPLATTR